MTGSAQHELAKWLTSLLQPVLQDLSVNCVSNSFTFVKEVRNFTFSPSVFLCSFDISSHFTNVLLTETIQICSDALYNNNEQRLAAAIISTQHLRRINAAGHFLRGIQLQQKHVSSNWRRCHGITVGPGTSKHFRRLPRRETLQLRQQAVSILPVCRWHVRLFSNEDDCNTVLSHLNSLHASLRFTHEKQFNHSLPFLDVLEERLGSEFSISVYRKPTFTGQYLRWNSFSPHKRKINLIGTLVHIDFMICSKGKLDPERDKIRSILLENGYPEHSINSTLKWRLQQLNSSPVHTVKKCPVYLHVPWIGNVSTRFEKQITSAVKRCFFSVEPHVVFTIR